MNREEFKDRVSQGAVLLDGATGSNLQEAGMKLGVCPEQWILEHPKAIVELQRAYVAAGTDILYAPTFTANRIKLAEYGLEGKLTQMNHELGFQRGGGRQGVCRRGSFHDGTAALSDRGDAV